jgi:hypothetical protein
MRIAVCERYQMHTECIGPIYYMCKKLGHDCVVYTCEQDDCNMLPFFEKCFDDVIQTRNISDIYRDADQFDFIVLNTSDEWNDIEIKMMGQSKVVVLHHDQKHENESMPNYFYLHPFKDEKDWIFPIYPCRYNHNKKASSSVMIIGTVNAFKDEYIPSKDLKAVERYLRKGKKLQVCARTIDDLEAYKTYPNLKVHLKKSTDDMLSLINDIDFIWIPVHVDGSSIYNKTSFSGSISFGVNMNKIMIMPKVLQEAYGLNGVLTYEKDISEIDLKKIDKIKLRKELDQWKQQREMRNIDLFKSKLSTK